MVRDELVLVHGAEHVAAGDGLNRTIGSVSIGSVSPSFAQVSDGEGVRWRIDAFAPRRGCRNGSELSWRKGREGKPRAAGRHESGEFSRFLWITEGRELN